MPDHPSVARVGAASTRVRLTGIAVDADGIDSRLRSAERALAQAGLDRRALAAVINVGAADAADTAAGICVRLGLGGVPGVQALDMVDDGCGVPSSIAVGASILAHRRGAVLLTVDGGALVVGAMPLSASAPQEPVTTAGRRTADVQLDHDSPGTAVEHVLSTVGDEMPIVAVVPGGLRLAPGRRFVSVCLASRSAAPIEGLLQARAEGCSEVVLVTANDRGRAAAVVCHLVSDADRRRE
ncbi:hypothetical protein [Gordonia hydrophobica]|uniref:Uncharacterized protein n=1 Tax=Gordonia hydrophobica TaxID=40516 RepID=A0ABZ2U7A3_9ACTN|nr:hypothetical protein [Gordonia hydrophobica]MBM7365501.1 hypothetical protein [Gordonia hydrophobica]